MKKSTKNVTKRQIEEKLDSVSEDTLEFLSLDDEMIETYGRQMQETESRKKALRKKKTEKISNAGKIKNTKKHKIREVYEEDLEEDLEEEELEPEDYEEEDFEPEYLESEDFETEEIEEIEDDEDDEDEDERYYEDEYYEDDEEDEEDEDDDEDDYDYESRNIFVRFGDFIANMSMLDHVVVMFGCFILAAAVATGALYANAKTRSGQVEAFAEICDDAQGIKVIGESGLLAVSNAESARLSQMFLTESGEEIQPEEMQNSTIDIAMNLTSIQSDLKIKFVNKQTNKLIGGIPFEVNVTGDNGKSYTLKDEDKDGIIYQTGVSAGSYTVTAIVLTGADYEKYTFPSRAETIKVTDMIAYQKVDVSDEIKSEAEVNVAVEDTAQQDTVIESTLTDTVEWVESTRQEKDADNNYQEIRKADIPDPAAIGSAGTFMKMSNVTDETGENGESGTTGEETGGTTGGETGGTTGGETGGENPDDNKGEGNNENPGGPTDPVNPPVTTKYTLAGISGGGTIQVGQTCTVSGTTNPAGGTITWSSSNSAVATVDASGVVTGVSEGTVTITGTTADGDSKGCAVTVTPTEVVYKSLSITGGGTIQVGKTCTITGTTDPAGGAITWSSSNSAIASVDASGVVTGVSVGTVTIKGTIGGLSKECTVTVTAAEVVYKSVTITGSTSIQVGKTGTLKATTDPTGGTVTWTSDNENVVKIDSNGVVTGVSVGKATITATCGNAKNTCQVTVLKDLSTDTVSKLKDKSGNQIYVKNADGKYVEATYADYYKDQKLYLRRANAVCFYTGWQSIDGYTYFYDKNGNVVTGEQIIQGAKYSFGSDGKLSSGSGVLGIDVSKWNGSIDWNAVKNSGITYVIIRCGYRGSSTGALIEDPKFKSNIQGAKAAGLKVGVYFFSQAVNEVEAVEEASMAINLVSGYGLNFPIFLDVESSGGRGDRIDVATRTAVCKAFCSTVQNSGYAAGIYANKTWFTSYINTGSLTSYKIWLAQYAAAPTYTATRYDMWQYSSKGTVGGISGSVDMNISYMNY